MSRDDGSPEIDDDGTERARRVMAGIEASDLELLDPPPGIWAAIEAGLDSVAARRPPVGQAPPPPLVVEYRIDADDVVAGVGQGWAAFARHNDAPELADPAPGRTLWSFIGSAEMRELWQLVVARVRAGRQEARAPFRCDGPGARRWFEMTITPEPDGGVRFRSELVFEETRPDVALLDPGSPRDPDASPIALCSWCGRGRHGQEWFDVEELVRTDRLLERTALPPVAYGICGACRHEMAADLLVADRIGDTAPPTPTQENPP